MSQCSRLARLKQVTSVNCHVDSDLARCRHGQGCFPKPIVCSITFSFELCSMTLLWRVIRYTTCNNDAWLCNEVSQEISLHGKFRENDSALYLTSACKSLLGLPLCWKAFLENITPHLQHWPLFCVTNIYAFHKQWCHQSFSLATRPKIVLLI